MDKKSKTVKAKIFFCWNENKGWMMGSGGDLVGNVMMAI
jgi:hypothetical protein